MTSLYGFVWIVKSTDSDVLMKIRVRFSAHGFDFVMPTYPSFIFAEVAPLTPHSPCGTITMTSFVVRGLSVSSNYGHSGSTMLASVLSVGVGNSLTCPGRMAPHAGGFRSSAPNSPMH